ncbi:MAG: ABC transporter ATP-binding protein [Clostridiales bacterium]
MIEVSNMSKKFNNWGKEDFYALNDISLKVKKGEIFGLLGPNGAGKTTFLRIISTVLSPSKGKVIVNNYNTITEASKVKRSIGFLSGNTKLYGRLTPKELLIYFGKLYDMSKKEIQHRIDELVKILNMEEFVDQPIEKLSTGQTQRTSIARCILHNPEIYILDEPTLGLDIFSSRSILEFIKLKAKEGKTIIFSTHYLEEAEFLCNRIALIHQGKILDTDSIENFKNNTGKKNLYDIFFHYIN